MFVREIADTDRKFLFEVLAPQAPWVLEIENVPGDGKADTRGRRHCR